MSQTKSLKSSFCRTSGYWAKGRRPELMSCHSEGNSYNSVQGIDLCSLLNYGLWVLPIAEQLATPRVSEWIFHLSLGLQQLMGPLLAQAYGEAFMGVGQSHWYDSKVQVKVTLWHQAIVDSYNYFSWANTKSLTTSVCFLHADVTPPLLKLF